MMIPRWHLIAVAAIVAGSRSTTTNRLLPDVIGKNTLSPGFGPRGFASNSAELKSSPGKDLPEGIEVFLVFEEGGVEPIDPVNVVSGSKDVDDRSRQAD